MTSALSGALHDRPQTPLMGCCYFCKGRAYWWWGDTIESPVPSAGTCHDDQRWPSFSGAEALRHGPKVGKRNFSFHSFLHLSFRHSGSRLCGTERTLRGCSPAGVAKAMAVSPLRDEGKWAPNKCFSVGAMHISAFLDHSPSLHPLWAGECARMTRFFSVQPFSIEQRQSWEHCTSKRGELMNEKTLTFTQFRHVTFI